MRTNRANEEKNMLNGLRLRLTHGAILPPPIGRRQGEHLKLQKVIRPPTGVNERHPVGPWPTRQLPDEQQRAWGEWGLNKRGSTLDADNKGAGSWAGITV